MLTEKGIIIMSSVLPSVLVSLLLIKILKFSEHVNFPKI